MKKRWMAAIGLGATVAAAQAVPVDRSNPPVEQDLAAPPAVQEVLRRACYDCHSHETAWPWYSYVAPLSWLVARDVREGRDELNFSRAGRDEIEPDDLWEEVAEGHMPPAAYTRMHPEATLGPADLALLRAWAETAESAEREDDGRRRRRRGGD